MHEPDPRLLVSGAMILAIVNQHVAGLHVLMLVPGHAGDDWDSREMFGGPGHLLRRGPIAEGKTGQDRRPQMPDAIEHQPRVRHFWQAAVEIPGIGDAPPKF